MWNKIDTETKLGSVCATVAIIAALIEMMLNGFTASVNVIKEYGSGQRLRVVLP